MQLSAPVRSFGSTGTSYTAFKLSMSSRDNLRSRNDNTSERSSSLPPHHRRGQSMPKAQQVNGEQSTGLETPKPIAVDYTHTLIQSVASLVKTRTGSVLSRGMILKSDHYPSGRAMQLDINLQGAPNFRSPRLDGLNVFGVAQPRLQGLKAILSVLGCRPKTNASSQCIWFSTREEPIGMYLVILSEPLCLIRAFNLSVYFGKVCGLACFWTSLFHHLSAGRMFSEIQPNLAKT